MKAKKEIKEKIIQCLIYPIVVLVTAILIVFIIMFYVLPRIQGIFEAFSDNANDILLSITKVKANLTFAGIMLLSLVFGSLIFYLCYKKSRRGNEKRFAIFEQVTYPLLEKYRKQGVRVETIESIDAEETLNAVLKVLNEYNYQK